MTLEAVLCRTLIMTSESPVPLLVGKVMSAKADMVTLAPEQS